MRINIILCQLVLYLIFPLSVISQGIVEGYSKIILQKTEALIDQYEIYFNLIGDVNEDQTARGQEFLSSFTRLFDNEVAMVFNDLDPEKQTSPRLPPEKYGRNILLWYPSTGVKCEIDKESIEMGMSEHLWGSSHYVDVKVEKSISGIYMDKNLNQTNHELVFRISFKKEGQRIFYFKIAGIRHFNEDQAADFVQISENKTVTQQESTIPQPPVQVEPNQFESKIEGIFKDDRDGNEYKWVKIGEQIWMAENLAYNVKDGSSVYNNENAFSKIYGRLYDWETACKVCPEGWQLPSDKEWNELAKFIAIENEIYQDNEEGQFIAKYLKKSSGWNYSGEGLDIYYFSAKPAGYRSSDASFNGLGRKGYWWSSTDISYSDAWYRALTSQDNQFFRRYFNKNYQFSVRCLKNDN